MSDDAAAVGLLRIRLRLPSRTLKEKRAIIKSVLGRIQNRYNVSAAEVGELDTPGVGAIAIVCVSNDGAHADSVLQEVARFVEGERLDAEIIGIETELMTM